MPRALGPGSLGLEVSDLCLRHEGSSSRVFLSFQKKAPSAEGTKIQVLGFLEWTTPLRTVDLRSGFKIFGSIQTLNPKPCIRMRAC